MLAPLYGKVVCLEQLLDQHRIHQANVTQSASSLSFNKTRLSRINYLQKVVSRYESVQKIAEERQISEGDHRQVTRALALTNLRLMFQIREYRTIKDFISDLVYTYSLNGVARRLLKKFGR